MKIRFIRITWVFLLYLLCSVSDFDKNNNQVKSIRINKLEWMTENLNVSIFRNGDTITRSPNNEEWRKAGKGRQTCMVLL